MRFHSSGLSYVHVSDDWKTCSCLCSFSQACASCLFSKDEGRVVGLNICIDHWSVVPTLLNADELLITCEPIHVTCCAFMGHSDVQLYCLWMFSVCPHKHFVTFVFVALRVTCFAYLIKQEMSAPTLYAAFLPVPRVSGAYGKLGLTMA